MLSNHHAAGIKHQRLVRRHDEAGINVEVYSTNRRAAMKAKPRRYRDKASRRDDQAETSVKYHPSAIYR